MMGGFELAVTCLALNVFKEARGEPPLGQQAVALVTINRVKISGKDVCQVVFEDSQFSWTITDARSGILLRGKRPARNNAEWKQAEQSARRAMYMRDFTGGATHFHDEAITPYWAKSFEYVGQWGGHKFYRGDYGKKSFSTRQASTIASAL